MRRRLRALYPAGEAEAIIRLIFESLKGWSPVDIVMNEDKPLSDFIKGKIEAILERLERHEPIQYILGTARFYGLDLKVCPGVLIPRPETEELVDMIVKRYGDKSDLRVLDACTGSGCIALALARNLKFAHVEGFDLSEEALDVARENAKALKCRVEFSRCDALMLPRDSDRWDIIVSNPPYIVPSEAADMDANVLDYEPHEALFVPQQASLLFYRAMAEYAIKALVPGGSLYFEINPLYAVQLVQLLKDTGFEQVTLYNDIHNRLRFAYAQRPSDDY